MFRTNKIIFLFISILLSNLTYASPYSEYGCSDGDCVDNPLNEIFYLLIILGCLFYWWGKSITSFKSRLWFSVIAGSFAVLLISYSPKFIAVVFGWVLLIGIGLCWLWADRPELNNEEWATQEQTSMQVPPFNQVKVLEEVKSQLNKPRKAPPAEAFKPSQKTGQRQLEKQEKFPDDVGIPNFVLTKEPMPPLPGTKGSYLGSPDNKMSKEQLAAMVSMIQVGEQNSNEQRELVLAKLHESCLTDDQQEQMAQELVQEGLLPGTMLDYPRQTTERLKKSLAEFGENNDVESSE